MAQICNPNTLEYQTFSEALTALAFTFVEEPYWPESGPYHCSFHIESTYWPLAYRVEPLPQSVHKLGSNGGQNLAITLQKCPHIAVFKY